MRCILHNSIIVAEGVSRAAVGVVLPPGNARPELLGLMPCSHIILHADAENFTERLVVWSSDQIPGAAYQFSRPSVISHSVVVPSPAYVHSRET